MGRGGGWAWKELEDMLNIHCMKFSKNNKKSYCFSSDTIHFTSFPPFPLLALQEVCQILAPKTFRFEYFGMANVFLECVGIWGIRLSTEIH